MEEEGIYDVLPKKEVIQLNHERDRLVKFYQVSKIWTGFPMLYM